MDAKRLEELAERLMLGEYTTQDLHDAARCVGALAETKKILFAYGDKNDATSWPWWGVAAKNRMGPSAILAGPFFSRERAEQHRKAREYDYGKGSIVYCFSGYHSHHYRDLIAAVEAAQEVKL